MATSLKLFPAANTIFRECHLELGWQIIFDLEMENSGYRPGFALWYITQRNFNADPAIYEKFLTIDQRINWSSKDDRVLNIFQYSAVRIILNTTVS